MKDEGPRSGPEQSGPADEGVRFCGFSRILLHSRVERDEFITATEIAFERLMSPTKGLRPEQMEEPIAPGKWSFKGMAAHFTFWNGLVLKRLEAIHHDREAEWFGPGDFARLNGEAAGRAEEMPLKRVMSELRITHSALMEAVRRVNMAKLSANGEIPDWLIETVTEHYDHHRPQVEEWIARLTAEGRGPLTTLPLKEG
jgi:hypothetical protein